MLSESDTRAKLIDPAIHARGWTEDLIRREETAGAIDVIGGCAKRRSKGRTDYTLRVKVNAEAQPVAVALIEAKRASLPPGHGMEQGRAYADAKRLNVPFVFSSNGHLFVEYDRFTGITSAPRPMSEFPTPDQLRARYEQHMGFSLESPAARPLLTHYAGGEGTRRYYQDAAIRAVLEKVARCQVSGEPPRALLSLATGAGKTFIAVNLLKRIADAGQLRRALFVCDRDELRNQGLGALQNLFGSDTAAATGGNPEKNARIVVATYQTLDVDSDAADANFLTKNYPENYFSHIIIDECHRSAWGKWSLVLTRNPDAVQVGLTATPRQLEVTEDSKEAQADLKITADNVKYFGEPVYEYDLAQAIEDGYLAACEILKGRVNLDDTGISLDEIIARNPTDALTGRPVSAAELPERYEKTQYEDRILLPDRVSAMCQDLFQYLLDTGGPEQKTIIFCARDRHADDVAATMNNLYAAWCAQNGRQRLEPFAFKCTAASSGSDQLPDLRGGARRHFIATTVDLLTTGVDVPCVKNIVFFKYVRSPIAFYQMIGRGTRIDMPSGKLLFRVYDYTNATRLFGKEFKTRPAQPRGEGTGPAPPEPPEPTIVVEGFDVVVTPAGRLIVTQVEGKAMLVPIEEYKQRLAARLVAEAPSLDAFRLRWIDPQGRRSLIDSLVASGYSPSVVRMVDGMDDFDLFDVLAELGYGMAPRTRTKRADAFVYKQRGWLSGLPGQTAATVEALAAQFSQGGTEGLENPHIFQTPEVIAAGGLSALKIAGNPADLLRETKQRMFAA